MTPPRIRLHVLLSVAALAACRSEAAGSSPTAVDAGVAIDASLSATNDDAAVGDAGASVDAPSPTRPDATSDTPDAGPPASYTNPVLDQDFADPTVIRAPDRTYYAFSTQGALGNIQVAKSLDLTHWTTIGDALPSKPPWGTTSNAFWAPHVVLHGSTWYLYFASDQDAAVGKCIGVATSTTPEGPYTATASPIVCNTGFIAIDPMVFDDPASGKTWLYWGSDFAPISVQELGADRESLAPGSSPQAVVTPGSGAAYQNLVEGAWMMERGGSYYLFYSGDDCCGSSGNGFVAHYAVMVSRASSPTGPFAPYPSPSVAGSSVIVAANAQWDGPGHNAVIRDEHGDDWLLYHAIDTSNRTGGGSNVRRPMLLDRLVYTADGWPTVIGATPSTTPQVGPETR